MSDLFPRKSYCCAFRRDCDQRNPRRCPSRFSGEVHVFGFSTIELLIVVAIVISVTAISLPTLTNVVATSQLRGGMNDLSGLFQNARNLAVRQNIISRVRFQLTNGEWVGYVDNGASPTGLTTSVPQIWLPRQFSKVSAPSGGAGSPSALTAATCGSSSAPDTIDDTYFSSVGIPCQYSSGACSGGQAFAYYFNYAASLGGTRWTSICVSPAGRITTWYWTGGSWTN